MLFKPEFSWQFLSPEQIIDKTIRALRNHVEHLRDESPFYRELLKDIDPSSVQTLDDFAALPFTTRQLFSKNWHSFVSGGVTSVVETVMTNGTAGKPLLYVYSRNDLDRLAYGAALSFHSCGVGGQDRIQIMYGLDRFCAGISFYHGAMLLGGNVSRAGQLPAEIQKSRFETLLPTVLVGIPSELMKLARDLEKKGFDVPNSSVEKLVCTCESVYDQNLSPNSVSRDLQQLWGAQVYSVYNLTEASAPMGECMVRGGLHTRPELVHIEVVAQNGEPVPDGTPGELVVTPLGNEAMPLLRYRTGDVTYIVPGECECGRGSPRIGPVLGRKSQLLLVNGSYVYPLNVTNVLDGMEEVNDYAIVVENNSPTSDRVTVHAAAPASSVEKIVNQLRAEAKVSFPVLISNVATIQSMRPFSRVKQRVIDKRVGRSQ